MKTPVVLSWSSGKDAAYTLYKLQRSSKYEVTSLLSTLNEDQEISMHGVSEKLLDAQSLALQLPLKKIIIRKNLALADYNDLMNLEYKNIKNRGCSNIAYGDILLKDLKNYREKSLKNLNMIALLPLWKEPTSLLAQDIIKSGIMAVVVAVDGSLLNKSFLGRLYDESFLQDLPPHVDPCGENGEFHTFVYDGPHFNFPIPYQLGSITSQTFPASTEGAWSTTFHFCDLIPASD